MDNFCALINRFKFQNVNTNKNELEIKENKGILDDKKFEKVFESDDMHSNSKKASEPTISNTLNAEVEKTLENSTPNVSEEIEKISNRKPEKSETENVGDKKKDQLSRHNSYDQVSK